MSCNSLVISFSTLIEYFSDRLQKSDKILEHLKLGFCEQRWDQKLSGFLDELDQFIHVIKSQI